MSSTWIDISNLKKPLKFNEFSVNFNTDLYNAKPLPNDIQKKLDNRWNELLNDDKPGRILYNESKFRLHSIDWKANEDDDSKQLILNLGLTDYKSFICTQQQILPDEIRQHIEEDHLSHPLGVGCLLITSDNYFVFVKRSSACIDSPHMYDIPGGHAEPRNLKTNSKEDIIEEIISSTIAECVDETNVDRNSLLVDSFFFVIVVVRNQTQYGRPAIEFCLRTSMTSDELQQRYDLQTHIEANETSELKFWPINKISDLLNSSQTLLSITPACHYNQWLFTVEQLKELRTNANNDYIRKSNSTNCLTVDEEAMVLRYYELQLKDFCEKFEPPMTKMAIAVCMQYFKRFYLNNSVMDYHPKDIYLICVYLTCKTEELRISITDFVANIKNDPDLDIIGDILLSYELLLIEKLKFQLVIHTAYRPFEGLVIDLKTHYLRDNVNDADRLRLTGYKFLDDTLLTDVYFLFPPSQIALTALLFASVKATVQIDEYILKHIYGSLESVQMQNVKETIRLIANAVREQVKYKKGEVKQVVEKLDKCYNILNDPRSEEYKKKRFEQFQIITDYEAKHLP
ncbi:unnamed protein product [Rotaria magnacalcarata]|uniref:Nudix hydrolase domain-containing protein n=4 Tax=Rotaria magnacalcarata TaxID=392030 RepID=A0A816YQF7_9BILA|nr:unnamed protein product [Rotaria magnacalcarata]CAF2160289.1 unnamed protein product [Rotaria magnacalcarata]